MVISGLFKARKFDGDAKPDLSHITALINVASATRMTLGPHDSPLATVFSNVHKQNSDSALSTYTNTQLYH